MLFDAVGIGECVVDLVGVVNTMPRENSKKDISSFKQFVGGPVVNSLFTLSHLGKKTAFIGGVGSDDYGQFIKKNLQKANINTFNLTEKKGKTPFHFVVVSKYLKSRTIFKKKNHLSSIEELSPYHEFTIKNSKVLLMDRKAEKIGIKAAKFAKQNKVMVVFSASNTYNNFIGEMMRLADVFIAPEDFLKHIGFSKKPEEGVKKIWNLKKKFVVLTSGPKGCIGTADGSVVKLPRFDVPKIVDTNGAGDIFHGAFVYGMIENWPLAKICRFANKIAALKCTILGNNLAKLNLKKYVK